MDEDITKEENLEEETPQGQPGETAVAAGEETQASNGSNGNNGNNGNGNNGNKNGKKVHVYSGDLAEAYESADGDTRAVLDALFGDWRGEGDCEPSLADWRTIRTYGDACAALGESVDEEAMARAGVPPHMVALMKLELVCRALWGGENRTDPVKADGWNFPWFSVVDEDALEGMGEDAGDWMLDVMPRGSHAAFGCVRAGCGNWWSAANVGYRLCLDTEEKALHFGRQFADLWAEYLTFNFNAE